MAIDRSWIGTDDDGSGETGTVANTAYVGTFCDAIDAAIAGGQPNNLAYDLLPDADGTRKLGSAAKSWDGSEIINLPAANVSGTMGVVRITPRVTTIVSSATPTVNTDTCDAVTITALAAAITSMTTNLSGTPTNFQKLIVRIKDDGTARAITWGASFEAKGTALPTTTVISKVLTVGFIYDTVTSKWGCVAAAQEA